MFECQCYICKPENAPKNVTVPKHNVTVKMMKDRLWAVKVGTSWVGIDASKGLTLDELRVKVFSPMEDVRAHPSSNHFDGGVRG